VTVLPPPSEEHPRRAMLHGLRPVLRAGVGLWWDLHVHGADRAPAEGPVVFASNHIGWLDGPLLAICAPRPVHALTKTEMFAGRMGAFLRGAGQIPLDRFGADPSAVKACVRVLGDGGAVGVFPEGTRGDGELHRFHHGAAYLALVSGAPVVPVVLLGSREPGGGINSLPARGARIDLVLGAPVRLGSRPWPRTPGMVRDASMLLRERLLETLDEARRTTGRELPGPLPAGQDEDDPATGLVDEGPR
jgi:1-acyl-sn-glycerol-3-phosphate acyltransferase